MDSYLKPGTHQADGQLLGNVRWLLSVDQLTFFGGVDSMELDALCFSANLACRNSSTESISKLFARKRTLTDNSEFVNKRKEKKLTKANQ